MAEKRFKEVFPNIIESSCSFTDNGKGITHKEVVDLLNELYEENEGLKAVNDRLFQGNLRLAEKIIDCRKILND